jgi:RNA polymerase-interacting CarD/CdnL/TRCF family regulator
VIGIEEMLMGGVTQQYYVVEVELLKLWVPVSEADAGSIRFPSDREQFEKLFDILREPGGPLPDNPYKRIFALRQRMQKRSPEALCHVIRDLTDQSHQHPLSVDDSSILVRAKKHLLDEWVLALGTPLPTAVRELEALLQTAPFDPSLSAVPVDGQSINTTH